MAGVGVDIKDAYREVGVAVTFLRDSGNLSGEYVDISLNSQVTKPFIREFFLEVGFPYDTRMELGDIVSIDLTSEKFIVMNKTADIFENEIIEYGSVLYKSNVSGEILRQSGEIWDPQTYEKRIVWDVVQTNAYALQTEPLFGNRLIEEELGLLNIQKNELYIPTRYGIKVHDRYECSSGEYFMISNIKKRRYPVVDVCELEEDNR
jgi:hypothetical protein